MIYLLHDEDTPTRSGWNVDIVKSCSSSTYQTQLWGGSKDFVRDFGLGAYNQYFIILKTS
jgi:hypothetical protein